MFEAWYPNCHWRDEIIFPRLVQRLRTIGSFRPIFRRCRNGKTKENIINVLGFIPFSPGSPNSAASLTFLTMLKASYLDTNCSSSLPWPSNFFFSIPSHFTLDLSSFHQLQYIFLYLWKRLFQIFDISSDSFDFLRHMLGEEKWLE